MAKEYKIKQILDYETDGSGFIRVEFRLIGDEKNKVRYLEGNNYTEWVETLDNNRNYSSDTWGSELYDEDFHTPYNVFSFEDWKEENEDESVIKKFIYENFTITDLPDPE